jgi:pimeloyl-ACP methyl ester carboxylesterase
MHSSSIQSLGVQTKGGASLPAINEWLSRIIAESARCPAVFAHGLWADGSCFSILIPALLAEGHEVMASQHGLDSLATDVAAVKACLSRVRSPADLVGHSYGGTLITHAGI